MALDDAIAQCDRLRSLLKRKRTAQVRGIDERGVVKASALAWFNSARPVISKSVNRDSVSAVDERYKYLLESADKAASRNSLIGAVKSLRGQLIGLRSEAVASSGTTDSSDTPPSFAPLISDAKMQAILASRWAECVRCVSIEAPLAATVMMGGLLEALLLARINREPDKAPVFTAKSAPKDKGGSTKPLNEWMLKNYIEVVYERGWISVSAKDVSEVLRDYRNFVHPFKQLSHGVHLSGTDAKLLWEITKSISKQVIASTTSHAG